MEENKRKLEEELKAPKKHKNKVVKKNFDIIRLLKNKIFQLGLLGLVVIIAIIIIIINLLNTSIYDKYYKYEEKMNIYGFNKMYDNESAATTETVTKMEAIKMVLAVALNTDDITNYIFEDRNYQDASWANYGQSMKITTKSPITADNYSEQISYIDVIEYFYNAQNILLSDIQNDELDKNIGDINEYTLDEQVAIKVLVANDVLVEAINDVNGQEMIFKGQLNELVINFANEFNTITFGENNKMNIDPENVPSNADQYPFTLANFDKSVYELPLIGSTDIEFYSPASMFTYKKDSYQQMILFTEDFLETMLNIDYNTITAEKFAKDLNSYLIFDLPMSDIEEYVNYVKENEIKISGEAVTVVPAIYSDGMNYRVRTQIKFTVENSKTTEDILFGDLGIYESRIYNNDTYEFYVDYKMTDTINTETIYVSYSNLYSTILEKEKSGITLKENMEE